MANYGLQDITALTADATPQPASATDIEQNTKTGAGLLKDILQAQQRELDVQDKVANANTQVLTVLQQAQEGTADTVDKAYSNILKTERLPGGIKGPVAKVLGLFDKSYDPQYNQTTIDAASARLNMAGERAKTITTINQQTATRAAQETAIKERAFGGFVDLRKLGQQDFQNETAAANSRYDRARVLIQLNAEGDRQTSVAIDGMSEQAAAKALKDASTGKGDYVGKEALLIDHLRKSKTADLALHELAGAVQANDTKRAQDALHTVAENIPATQLQGMIVRARQAGSAFINLGSAEKPVNLPYTIAVDAFNKVKKQEAEAETAVTANLLSQTAIPARLANQSASLAAMVELDPKAAQEFQTLNAQIQGLDLTKYPDIQAMDTILTESAKRTEPIVKAVAATLTTPEAKAAFESFSSNGGKFSTQSGNAFALEGIGNFGIQQTSKFPGAWAIYNNALATSIKGAPITSTLDTASLLAGLNPAQNSSFNENRRRVMADPAVRKAVADKVAASVAGDALNNTIQVLAAPQPGPVQTSPVWGNLAAHPELWMDANAQGDPDKLAYYLEQQTVASGRKVDYNKAFISALRNTGMADDRGDPKLSVHDRALMTGTFGPNAHAQIVQSLINSYRPAVTAANQALTRAVNEDVSGITSAALGGDNGAYAISPVQLPSATGLPVTADDVRNMFIKK